jgi:DNA helicase II / ATP-dependent DNA helicase PcrA
VKICALRQQVLDCTGHVIVLGGPGSGKTTIALKKALKRIEEGLLPGQSVLFLSFSRAAVARILQASKAEVPRNGRSLLNVQTFHSFFWDLLTAHAYLIGAQKPLSILMPQDERALSGGINAAKNPVEWTAWLKERERLFVEEGRIAFDLFAPNAAVLLGHSALLRGLIAQKYPLIIVDEAQDTGPDAWRCIEHLASLTQILCLADLEQQIFDHLPGIGPERLAAISLALTPLQIDLGSENLRSPGSEIVIFGQDILKGTPRGSGYKGVTSMSFNQNADLAVTLRRALGCLQREVRVETGSWAKNIAVLVPSATEAAAVSKSLNSGDKPVPHKLLFDEAEALLASRFAAFLLEPKESIPESLQVADGLMLLADMRKANGATGDVSRLLGWSIKIRAGKSTPARLVVSLRALLGHLVTSSFLGDPAKDWIKVKQALRASKEKTLMSVAQHLDYLVAFNRGKRISAGLGDAWMRYGEYRQARAVLDAALAQDLILDGIDDPEGVQVMTIHKSKGKQFDGVLIMRRGRHNGTSTVSSFIWRDDVPPYTRSRKILMVGITRARSHTMLLQQVWPSCPILASHVLRSPFDTEAPE